MSVVTFDVELVLAHASITEDKSLLSAMAGISESELKLALETDTSFNRRFERETARGRFAILQKIHEKALAGDSKCLEMLARARLGFGKTKDDDGPRVTNFSDLAQLLHE